MLFCILRQSTAKRENTLQETWDESQQDLQKVSLKGLVGSCVKTYGVYGVLGSSAASLEKECLGIPSPLASPGR